MNMTPMYDSARVQLLDYDVPASRSEFAARLILLSLFYFLPDNASGLLG
jgi:hypothetical protein